MPGIKVLHILHSFGIGGMEKGISMLAQNSSSDIEHVILCMEHSGDSQKLLPSGTTVVELGKKSGSSFLFLAKLIKAIHRINPDVIHTRNWGGMDGIIAARLAGRSQIVHGEHGWGVDDPLGLRKKRKFIRRLLSLGVSEFTAVSQQIKHWLENDVHVLRPVTQIYNGVDTSLFACQRTPGSLKQELGLSERDYIIGSVGRLDPIKDQAGLIAAFKEVRKTNQHVHLVIVGDGPERKRLETFITDGIYLLGLRDDIPKILSSFDIFVLNSLNEGVSNTILEAMAAGLPVVATAVGGNPELIEPGKNGILVHPHDISGLAQAMGHYLSSPELRAEHGQSNRRICAEKFSIKAMVAGYETVWRRVSGQPGGS